MIIGVHRFWQRRQEQSQGDRQRMAEARRASHAVLLALDTLGVSDSECLTPPSRLALELLEACFLAGRGGGGRWSGHGSACMLS